MASVNLIPDHADPSRVVDVDKARLLAECMTRPNPPMPFEEARAAFFNYLTPILEQRRAAPGSGLFSFIVSRKINSGEPSTAESLPLRR